MNNKCFGVVDPYPVEAMAATGTASQTNADGSVVCNRCVPATTFRTKKLLDAHWAEQHQLRCCCRYKNGYGNILNIHC